MNTQSIVPAANAVEPVVLFLRPTHSLTTDPRTGTFAVVVTPSATVKTFVSRG